MGRGLCSGCCAYTGYYSVVVVLRSLNGQGRRAAQKPRSTLHLNRHVLIHRAPSSTGLIFFPPGAAAAAIAPK